MPLLVAALDASGADTIRIGVFLQSPESTSEEVLSVTRAEVQRLIERPGAELAWREEISGQETFNRVLVVRLRGACSATLPANWIVPSTLGSTHISDGKVQPFIDISCDHVAAALSRQWKWPAGRIPTDVFGRALARVVAHEIFHALTESAHHDEAGLMKPAFDRFDLCARKLEIAPASLSRLDRALGIGAKPAD
jgi:hypothetical protein